MFSFLVPLKISFVFVFGSIKNKFIFILHFSYLLSSYSFIFFFLSFIFFVIFLYTLTLRIDSTLRLFPIRPVNIFCVTSFGKPPLCESSLLETCYHKLFNKFWVDQIETLAQLIREITYHKLFNEDYFN